MRVDIVEPLPITQYTFSDSWGHTYAGNVTLVVPTGSKAAYQAADYWKDFKEIVEDTPNITFADSNVKALCVANWDTNGDGELSESEAAAVTNLGTVFKNKTGITSFNELQYFTGLTSINYEAFYDCSGLTSVIIPNSVTEIDQNAFRKCWVLTSFTFNSAEEALTKVDDVYQIGTAEDLHNFAILTTAASSSLNACLTADIDYTGYTGSCNGGNFYPIGLNGYKGTFDGQGHTITLNIEDSHYSDKVDEAGNAMFLLLTEGGVIRNLRTSGTIESSCKFSAGILSYLAEGTVSHCVSDVNIISNIEGDCTDGGIVALGNMSGDSPGLVEYCVFAGSFQGESATYRGGIVGIGYSANSSNITLDNCLFIAATDNLSVDGSDTFIREPNESTTISNCYYLNTLGDASAGTPTTSEQLASGELCYLLNGESSESPNWYQTLGEDGYPVPFNTHGTVYKQEGIYTNTPIENTLYAADMSVCRGGKGDLPIILKNTENVRMFQFVLTLPEGLSIASENGELQAVLTDRAGTGHSLSCTRKDNGDYLFMVSQTNLEFFSGNSGDAVVKVKLAIPKDFVLGDYQISMKDVELTLYRDGTNIPITPANSNSILTVNPKRRGDANGSGTVTVTDISVTVDIILEEGYDEGADANGNGKVTVTDIADIVDIILATPVSSRKTNNKLDPQ